MIRVNFEEHCPFCHEEIDLDMEDGDRDASYTCECGSEMEMVFDGRLQLSASKPNAV